MGLRRFFHRAAGVFLTTAALGGPFGWGTPVIPEVEVADGSGTFTFGSTPGNHYVLQRNRQLGSRYWQDRSPLTTATAATETFSDEVTLEAGFWRVREWTAPVFWYDWEYREQASWLSAWGLGSSEESYAHVDRPYDWYIDQGNTGPGSGNNCGPCTVTMALKWYDPSFTESAESAREWSVGWRQYGWWYTGDITRYLQLHSVGYRTSHYTGANQIAGLISAGKLVLVCINTGYLSRNTNNAERVGRFYNYGDGHFFVIKGTRVVSGTRYFEVYDSNNWGATYGDGTPKGRNRHILADDLTEAITQWWPYLIVLESPTEAGPGLRTLETSPWMSPVDPAEIPQAWGR